MHPQRLVNVNVAERRARAAQVRNILQYVPRNQPVVPWPQLRCDSEENGELPDPFADDDANKELTEMRKRCSVQVVNQYLMDGFSAEHKRCEEWYRKTFAIENVSDVDGCAEAEPTSPTPPSDDDAEFSAEIEQLLAQCGLDVYLQHEAEEERKKLTAKKTKS